MNKAQKIAVFVILACVLLGLLGWLFKDDIVRRFFQPTESSLDVGVENSAELDEPESLVLVASDLSVPWAIAVLPDGDLLVTERPGTLLRLGQDGQRVPISGVAARGEGGLLGIALDPDFVTNQYIYLYLTTESSNGLVNRIERYTYQTDSIKDRYVLLDNIPGSSYHDGGVLAFGPDGKLYAGTGDAGDPDNAQDTSSLAGKILRLNADGSVPEDNPFNNYVYSYGHRNVQGITWDDQDRLWATEHGPSGAQSGYDELNLIATGANYGWPEIRGDETAEDMRKPVAHSGPDETWAPGAIAHADGQLYFSGLRGSRLYQATINGNDVSIKTHFANEFGRLRAVTIAGSTLYFSTSNTDGRGTQQPNDDKIYRLPLETLN